MEQRQQAHPKETAQPLQEKRPYHIPKLEDMGTIVAATRGSFAGTEDFPVAAGNPFPVS